MSKFPPNLGILVCGANIIGYYGIYSPPPPPPRPDKKISQHVFQMTPVSKHANQLSRVVIYPHM